jgi:hypothetical protein
MTPKNELALSVVLDEFKALRDEIQNRATAAYTILNINITAIAAVAGLLLSKKGDLRLLLILPLVSPSLGLLFVDHSLNIRNLGRYINHRLRPLVDEFTSDPRLLRYEVFVTEYEGNKLLRLLPLALPLTLLFAAVPLAALMFLCFEHTLQRTWAWTIWGTGALVTAAYLVMWTWFVLAPYRESRRVAEKNRH